MTSSDNDGAPNTSAPETVSCQTCQKELPSRLALAAEAKDYRLWFCSSECYARWQRDVPDGGKK